MNATLESVEQEKKEVPKASKKAAAKQTTKKKARKKTTRKKTKRNVDPYSLVIVESPSKAKTIKKYLGRGFQVLASNGHIKDLPKSKLGVDIKNDFAIELVPITGKKEKIKRVQELAKKAEQIYLAPDPDREGEAIAYHLAEEIGVRRKNIHRVLFNAVTKSAVKAAIEAPTSLDKNKYDSQRTRRVLDRLVGYKISPILWDKVQRGLSAGRVQSVALRVIVEREDEITEFKPEQWFSIHAFFNKDNTEFEGRYYGQSLEKKDELNDENTVKGILQQIENRDFKVFDIKKKESKIPHLLLQRQSCNKKLLINLVLLPKEL
jgi:DNA topoisomerase-1